MIDATVLADALVEAGILVSDGVRYKFGHWPWGWSLTADEAITDWRVAGKVLESVDIHYKIEPDVRGFFVEMYIRDKQCKNRKYRHIAHGKSLPRAIIEAWYEAVEGDS